MLLAIRVLEVELEVEVEPIVDVAKSIPKGVDKKDLILSITGL
jgi:hypothetical protein